MLFPLTDEECEILAGLDPAFLPVVLEHRRLCVLADIPWIAEGGRRSRAYQKLLNENPSLHPNSPAVLPGTSMHEVGFAVDVGGVRGTLQKLTFGRLAKELGLQWGGDFKPQPDWNHLESPQHRSAISAYVRTRMEMAT